MVVFPILVVLPCIREYERREPPFWGFPNTPRSTRIRVYARWEPPFGAPRTRLTARVYAYTHAIARSGFALSTRVPIARFGIASSIRVPLARSGFAPLSIRVPIARSGIALSIRVPIARCGAMQSMASASYADDQARSSEGEAGREERGERAPYRVISALHLNCGDNRWKISAVALARCEAVSAWRSDFRCTPLAFYLGRQTDCRLIVVEPVWSVGQKVPRSRIARAGTKPPAPRNRLRIVK